jgi:hypothetical protein
VAGGGISPLGKSWYRKGKRHREEGPAVEHADGRKEWYRHGKELTAAEFAVIREKELAEIGDAFKTGLTRKITASRPRPLKKRPSTSAALTQDSEIPHGLIHSHEPLSIGPAPPAAFRERDRHPYWPRLRPPRCGNQTRRGAAIKPDAVRQSNPTRCGNQTRRVAAIK